MSAGAQILKPHAPGLSLSSKAIVAQPPDPPIMNTPPGWTTETKITSMPESHSDEKVLFAMSNLLPQPSRSITKGFKDLFSLNMWTSPRLWKAGIIEGTSSMACIFLTGAVGVSIQGYPAAAIGPAIFFTNTIIFSLFIYGLSTGMLLFAMAEYIVLTCPATGAHINPLITLSTTITGLCHPVRAAIYIICQAIGGCVGGAFLRGGIGQARALQTHNGGCFLDPNGPTSVGMAFCIEFASAFALLFVAYGVGLDPGQKELYGVALGPLLVGALIGAITAGTSGLNPGYSGAGIFPGRCFGLQVGMGRFYRHDWVWYVPDFAAAVLHGVIYHVAPPYTRESLLAASYPHGNGVRNSNSPRRDTASIDVDGITTLEARV
ncbi:Major intrinsic protein (MIP) family transporter [Ceratobasidium theobromae]|uniref:Major intrinsic protein (MIP) family transporter n=1 Tax=Ceratobasidium theobromae TaxID=1582974 RepID=A0A5N5QKD1_9AGAM|nr:Major intrinsic protein (MIP) family transporter [Ceratobasidium theobromae]